MIRELAAPLAAREWLQAFWSRTGRLPYRWEIPPVFYSFFPRREVPLGWQAELNLMAGLKRAGLSYTWSPQLDAAGVDVLFELDGVEVQVQLKTVRGQKAIVPTIVRRPAHCAEVWLTVPNFAVHRLPELTPQLLAYIQRRLWR